jgi:sialic acid synthase SpsE
MNVLIGCQRNYPEPNDKRKEKNMNVRTQLPSSSNMVEVGDGLPSHLIAEIGLNHNGSEELAKNMIYSAAVSGASFVKFQKRSPKDLATSEFLDAPFAKCPTLGTTQREVRDRLELPLQSYKHLRVYAESLGLVFFSSAFDIPSLKFLLEAGIKIIKVASHSLTNGPLLSEIAKSKLAVIMSLGGSTDYEIDRAITILRDNPLVLLHCVSAYPTPDGMAALDTIQALRKRYERPVGFSSHEVGIDLSVAASVLGACMIERHFTLNRAMIGLDQSISLEPHEFSEMAKIIRRIHTARGVAKGLHDLEKAAKYSYHVGVCTSRPLNAGTKITSNMIVCKQPLVDPVQYFTGLEIDSVIGHELLIDLPADSKIPRTALQKRE